MGAIADLKDGKTCNTRDMLVAEMVKPMIDSSLDANLVRCHLPRLLHEHDHLQSDKYDYLLKYDGAYKVMSASAC